MAVGTSHAIEGSGIFIEKLHGNKPTGYRVPVMA
jgi:hypothetical protein